MTAKIMAFLLLTAGVLAIALAYPDHFIQAQPPEGGVVTDSGDVWSPEPETVFVFLDTILTHTYVGEAGIIPLDGSFIREDINGNGLFDIDDVTRLIERLFGPPVPEPKYGVRLYIVFTDFTPIVDGEARRTTGTTTKFGTLIEIE